MFSKIVNQEVKPQTVYPCLKRSDNDTIVAFESISVGIVLHTGKSNWKLFTKHGNWNECDFTPFTGQVILSNDEIK